jgi:hypothetical protein
MPNHLLLWDTQTAARPIAGALTCRRVYLHGGRFLFTLFPPVLNPAITPTELQETLISCTCYGVQHSEFV